VAVDVEIGSEVPPFAREAGFQTWNRYAAVNYEFVPIHMDDEAGRAAGYDGAFGMGNLQLAWLHCMLRDWIEPEGGRIVRVECSFRSPSLKGRTVTARGVVTGVRDEGDEQVVDLEVWTEDDEGARLAPGTATIAFPR
jgi:acyl dehydratase